MNKKQLIAKLEQMVEDRGHFDDMLKDFSVTQLDDVSEYTQMSFNALMRISQAHTIDLKYVLGKMKEAK
jgi:hypothetical protein